MDNKDLRKLGRKELLEILLEQTKRIEELEISLEKAKNELSERKSSLREAGSLAEASLILSDIFKAADETANIYMKNIKELARKEERQARKELKEFKAKKLEEIEKECQKRILEAEKSVKKIESKKNNEVKDSSKKNTKKITKKSTKKENVNE